MHAVALPAPIALLRSAVPVAVIGACFALAVVVPIGGRNDDAVEESLAAAESDASSTSVIELDWTDLSFLPYDRLYAFGNAATRPGVEQRLGFAWPEGRPAIPPGADETLLVFVARRSVVAWRRVDTGDADLSCLAALRSLRRSDALLVARRHDGRLVIGPGKPVRGRQQARAAAHCARERELPVQPQREPG